MSKSLDENDRHKAGTLPADPEADASVLVDAPRILTVRQLVEGSAKRAQEPRTRGACTTGHHKLDRLTGGLRPGHCWVFGAETSWGKSSWAILLTDLNLRAKRGVLIVSFEDSEGVYGDRLLARRADVKAIHLRDGRLDPDEMTRVAGVVNRAEDAPVFLDARGKTAEWACEGIQGLCAEHPEIQLVIVDYLQEARSAKRHQDRKNEVSFVASLIRSTVKRLGRAGLILSQLTTEEGEKPSKYSIRETKDAAMGAEGILLGFYSSDGGSTACARDGGKGKPERVILVAKAKDGPVGYAITQPWNERWAGFEAVADPETAVAAAGRDMGDGMFEEFGEVH